MAKINVFNEEIEEVEALILSKDLEEYNQNKKKQVLPTFFILIYYLYAEKQQ